MILPLPRHLSALPAIQTNDSNKLNHKRAQTCMHSHLGRWELCFDSVYVYLGNECVVLALHCIGHRAHLTRPPDSSTSNERIVVEGGQYQYEYVQPCCTLYSVPFLQAIENLQGHTSRRLSRHTGQAKIAVEDTSKPT